MNEDEVRSFLATPAGQKIIQPIADKRVAEGISTYRQNHATPDISGLEAKIQALEIQNYAIVQCQRRGIDYDLLEELDMEFSDTIQVDQKLEVLEKRFATISDRTRNETLASGFKPGGSSTPPDKINVRDLSKKRLAFLDSIGELDSLLES